MASPPFATVLVAVFSLIACTITSAIQLPDGCTCTSRQQWSGLYPGYAFCDVSNASCGGVLSSAGTSPFLDYAPCGCLNGAGVCFTYGCGCNAANTCTCSNSPCWPATTTCGAGYFVRGGTQRYAGAQSWECAACPAGTFNGCTTCNNLVCSFCPVGSYTGTSGMSSCTPCPAGMTTSARGASDISYCYSTATGQGGSGSGGAPGGAPVVPSNSLSPFPLLPSDDPAWATDYMDLKSLNGAFGRPITAKYWPGNESCPVGSACIGRLTDACPFPRRCLGNNTCDSDFLPPVCVRCPSNYFVHASIECRPCSGVLASLSVSIIFVTLLFGALAAAALAPSRYRYGNFSFSSETSAMSKRKTAVLEKKDLLSDCIDRAVRLRAVASIVRASSPVPWPAPFAWIISFGTVLAGETSVGLTCYGFSYWVGPTAALGAKFLAWAVVSVYVYRQWRNAGCVVPDEGDNDDDAPTLRKRLNFALSLAGSFAKVVLYGVMTNIINSPYSFGVSYPVQDSSVTDTKNGALGLVTLIAGLAVIAVLLINFVSECCPWRCGAGNPSQPCCPTLSPHAKKKRCRRCAGNTWVGTFVNIALGMSTFIGIIGSPGWLMVAIQLVASIISAMLLSCACCTDEHIWGCCPCSPKDAEEDGLWAVGPTQTWAAIACDVSVPLTSMILLLSNPLESQTPFPPRTISLSSTRAWSLGFLNLILYVFYAGLTSILAFGGVAVHRFIIIGTVTAVVLCAAIAAAT